jgi:hypothetical protein
MMLGGQAYGNSNRGMDQFYGAQRESDTSPYLMALANQMGAGYGDSSDRVSGNTSAFTSGWADNKGQYDSALAGLNKMYEDLAGRTSQPSGSAPSQKRSPYAAVLDATPGEIALNAARTRQALADRESAAQRSLRHPGLM